jgi:hypothetical protein
MPNEHDETTTDQTTTSTTPAATSAEAPAAPAKPKAKKRKKTGKKPKPKTTNVRVRLLDQQNIGEAVARAVEAAEERHPGPATGVIKRREVIRQVVSMLPIKGPCAPFLKALARIVVGVLVECAVSAFQRKWKTA